MNNKHYFFFIKNQKYLRIDKYLFKNIPNITRNKIQNSFNAKKISVNNVFIKKNYRIKPLDVISVMINYHKKNNIEDIYLKIVYEDDVLIVINKPSGIVVHDGTIKNKATLLNAIKHHINIIRVNTEINRFGLVHRIDKESSGLLLIAKNDFSLQHLNYQFFTRSIYRRYIALVWGILEGNGTIKGNIGRSFIDKRRMEMFSNKSFGKNSITHYKVIENFNIVTLVSCRLDTGRTHQIRTHLAHLGNPIFNDILYKKNNNKQKKIVKNCFSILEGQFLHAQSFIFIHPITEKSMHFEIPLPRKIYDILDIIKNNKI